MSQDFEWTLSAQAKLVELWKSGLSAEMIRQEMGLNSRGAVIGKLHRLGCTGKSPNAPLTAKDGAHLSVACHKIKTATDQKYRSRRNKHAVRKDRPKPGWFQSGKKLQSRGFNKTLTKKFDGSVVRRDA